MIHGAFIKINNQEECKEALNKLEKLGVLWMDSMLPTHYIPSEANWLIIRYDRMTYSTNKYYSKSGYKDITEEILNYKNLYDD